MTIVLIILVVLLIVVAWRQQQSPSQMLNAVLVVLAMACLGVAVAVWRQPQREIARRTSQIERVHEAIGFELGRAVAQAFPQGGAVLVLLNGLPKKFPDSGVGAAEVRGLQAGFGRANLQALPVGYTPASAEEAMEIQFDWPRHGVPFEKINEWFAAQRGAVAVVAFTIVGVLLGLVLVELFSRLPEIVPALDAGNILLAFSFSVCVGLFFGVYPARKAANLNPIDALRYE